MTSRAASYEKETFEEEMFANGGAPRRMNAEQSICGARQRTSLMNQGEWVVVDRLPRGRRTRGESLSDDNTTNAGETATDRRGRPFITGVRPSQLPCFDQGRRGGIGEQRSRQYCCGRN